MITVPYLICKSYCTATVVSNCRDLRNWHNKTVYLRKVFYSSSTVVVCHKFVKFILKNGAIIKKNIVQIIFCTLFRVSVGHDAVGGGGGGREEQEDRQERLHLVLIWREMFPI